MAARDFDIVVIGGGIIGLATAMALTSRLPRVRLAVLEKEAALASHQSSHNSGVIHSGVYYKPGSLKARTCVAGATRMVEFCREQGLPYAICGKLIVATSEHELPSLHELRRRGEANGVAGLRLLKREELQEVEPHCSGIQGLHVPGTGIADFGQVARRFAEVIASRGAAVHMEAEVHGLREQGSVTVVESAAGEFQGRFVLNCAGLHSDRVARLTEPNFDLHIIPFRGEYYQLAAESRHFVRSLIYPVPDPELPFLGVHFTRQVGGGVEAGPNAVLAFSREGYRKSQASARDLLEMAGFAGFWRMAWRLRRSALGEAHRSWSKAAFVRALQRLVPEVKESDLRPGGSGVRAQAVDRAGHLLDDFQVRQCRRVIHVCNVPSPAATASIVIGEQIASMLEAAF